MRRELCDCARVQSKGARMRFIWDREICNKNRRSPNSFQGRFVHTYMCKPRPLLVILSHVPVLLLPSWENHVVFSHLNYVFSCILSARCCLCKEWGKQNLNRGLFHTSCHSKLCIAVLRERRRIWQFLETQHECSDSASLAESRFLFLFLVYLLVFVPLWKAFKKISF